MSSSSSSSYPSYKAYSVTLSHLEGADMYVIFYVPVTKQNSVELSYMCDQLQLNDGTRPDAISIRQVDLAFAKLHPMNFTPTGIADVEACYFFETIKVPLRKDGQTIEEWLGDNPKYVDWSAFLH